MCSFWFHPPTFMLIVYVHPYCTHNLQALSCIKHRIVHQLQFQNQWIFHMLYKYLERSWCPHFFIFRNAWLLSGHSIHASLTKICISNRRFLHKHPRSLTIYSGYLSGSRAVLKLLRAWMLSLILWLIKVKSVCSLARKKRNCYDKTINWAKEWEWQVQATCLGLVNDNYFIDFFYCES